jgi:hypothetical protein
MPDETDPRPVIVPLIADTPPAPQPAVTPPAPRGMRTWIVLRGTTILGLVCIVIGLGFFAAYVFSDKEHLHDVIILWFGVGFFGFGCHLVSRQSVKNFLADVGEYIPFRKKSDGGGA